MLPLFFCFNVILLLTWQQWPLLIFSLDAPRGERENHLQMEMLRMDLKVRKVWLVWTLCLPHFAYSSLPFYPKSTRVCLFLTLHGKFSFRFGFCVYISYLYSLRCVHCLLSSFLNFLFSFLPDHSVSLLCNLWQQNRSAVFLCSKLLCYFENHKFQNLPSFESDPPPLDAGDAAPTEEPSPPSGAEKVNNKNHSCQQDAMGVDYLRFNGTSVLLGRNTSKLTRNCHPARIIFVDRAGWLAKMASQNGFHWILDTMT